MIRVELPPMRGGNWLGVAIEAHEIAGTTMFAITIKGRAGQPITREWFRCEATALAWALSQADSRGLPFFDLRDGGEPA